MTGMQFIFRLSFIVFICLLLYTCDKESGPVSSVNETPYGTVSQIDDYPLYKIDYSSDYKFDQFLQTGDIPFYTSNTSNSKNYGCTCFSIFGEGQRLLGRNYDWPGRQRELTADAKFIKITNHKKQMTNKSQLTNLPIIKMNIW